MMEILINKARKGRKSSGFTMIEMMIIIVMIGIIAAIAIPSFLSSGPRLTARTEARNILNMARLARSKAVSNGGQFGVYLDTANRQYLLFSDLSNPALMSYDLGDSVVAGPVTYSTEMVGNSSFSGDAVVFLATGRASQSGSFTFDISGGGSLYTVSVLAATGRSKLQ